MLRTHCHGLVAVYLLAMSSAATSCGSSRAATAFAGATAPPTAADAKESALVTPPVLIRGATVMTANGGVHSPGHLLLENGRILAIGDGPGEAPKGAQILEANGFYVTPGLIDAHSHIGVYPWPETNGNEDGNEAVRPITADVWAEHGFWPQDPALSRALAAGITALQVLPGSANLIGGRSFVIKLTPHNSARAMQFPGAPQGLKMACGENPKRVYGEHRNVAPMTRMGNVAGMRAAFQEATEYRRRWQRFAQEAAVWEKDHPGELLSSSSEAPEMPERDLGMETISQLLAGKILAQVHCYRADEMHVVLDLAEQFGFAVRAFHHAIESYKLRDRLAAKQVGAVVWADWWGFKMEALDGVPQNAAMVAAAGARAVIHSDSATEIRHLNQEAAKAMTAGKKVGIDLDENEVLRWVTANPAWVLGIDEQVGTLAVGKMADVVVWDRHPFSVYARPTHVFIDGKIAFDRAQAPRLSDFELGQGSGEVDR